MTIVVSVAVALTVIAATISSVHAKVYFEETFDKTWESRWVKSTWRQNDGTGGKFIWSAGKFYGDDEEAAKGIQTTPDARFFAIAAEFKEVFDTNKGKDLVIQYSVKNEQTIDCGGGYLKILPESSGPASNDLKDYDNETPYQIMFGPDICGGSKRVHAILENEGKNHLITKTVAPETDELTHVYTLILHPDNTYKILIDLQEKSTGSLEEDWEMLEPKMIKDPEASKPEDWIDEPMMVDPEDVKPEGYDDIPEKIRDTEATKPDDWDDDEDGDWEAPLIPNPEYKGPWTPKMIENPDYKGVWVHPEIDNPDFKPNPELYIHPNLKYVAFELWQVKSGTIFDNILITDDIEYAKKFAEDTWGKMKDSEKEKFDAAREEELEKMKLEREKMEEEAKKREEEEEEKVADVEEEEEEEEEHDGTEL